MLADLRFAWRALRAAPGYALAAVCCLALGLGANAAVLGVVDALLFRPPPGVAAPGRLVRVSIVRPMQGMPNVAIVGATEADRARLAAHARTVGALAAYQPMAVVVGRGPDAANASAVLAAPGYWGALGAHPALGRLPVTEEERPGAPATVIVSDRYWRTALRGDPRAVGRTLEVNGVTARVIGVAAPGFNGVELRPLDLWLPVAVGPRLRGEDEAVGRPSSPMLPLVARLRDAATLASAQAELRALLAQPTETAPGRMTGFRTPVVQVTGLRDGDLSFGDSAARLARWLAAVSALVLVVAAVNVAGLALARGVARRRELAVRFALGASRARVVRQLAAEGALVTAGGAVACGLVAAAVGALLRRFPALPEAPAFDARQAVLVLALAAPVMAVCGLVPAAVGARQGLRTPLHEGAGASPARARAREALLIGQLAVTLALVAGAALFLRSLRNALAVDLGFDAEHLVVVSPFEGARLNDRQMAVTLEALRERAARLPGVRAASVAGPVPFNGFMSSRVQVDGAAGPTNVQQMLVDEHGVDALGLRLVRGRALVAADRPAAGQPAPAVLVNEAMARLDWPGRDPVGRCVRLVGFDGSAAAAGRAPCATVVGVVRDARTMGFGAAPERGMYQPTEIGGAAGFSAVLVRLARPADARAAQALRRALAASVPDAPPIEARTGDDLLGPQLAPHRLGAALFTLYGALALGLAAVGLYGVASYDVARRARELAVRVALGARPRDLRALVVGAGARLALAGGVLGLAGALAGSRLLTGLLYGVRPADPLAVAGACGVLAAVALAASWLPARRAARVDPAAALRAD